MRPTVANSTGEDVSKGMHLRMGTDEMWRRTLLAAQLGRVHGLAEHLDGQTTSLLQIALLLVILLEQALGAGVVGADAGGLPAAVVAGRVALVQLELTLGVVAGVDEGDTERTQTTVLSVTLLQIA